jgi:hypothetical protein
MNRIFIMGIVIVLSGVLAGCVSGNTALGKMTAREVRDTFKIGTTTVDDVHALLGDPICESISGSNLVWRYEYKRIGGRCFAVPLYPIILSERQGDQIRKNLVLFFGQSNVLENVSYQGN